MSNQDFLRIKKALAEVKFLNSLMNISYNNLEYLEDSKDNEKAPSLFDLNYDVIPENLDLEF